MEDVREIETNVDEVTDSNEDLTFEKENSGKKSIVKLVVGGAAIAIGAAILITKRKKDATKKENTLEEVEDDCLEQWVDDLDPEETDSETENDSEEKK